MEFTVFDNPTVVWRPSPRNPRECPHISYITRIIDLHFALIVCGSIHFFLVGSEKLFILQKWRFGRSRSSKVIDFGTNRKCVCDFLLVHHSNLAIILHHFRDIAVWPHPYSTMLDRIARVGVNSSRNIISREIVFYMITVLERTSLQTDRQTEDGPSDGRTTYCGITAPTQIIRIGLRTAH